jgi:hypothetical protein
MKNLAQACNTVLPGQSFHIESDFCMSARALRDQFEKQAVDSPEGGHTVPGLEHAARDDQFSFLTAGAHRVFDRDLVGNFIGELGAWAADALITSHVSMPQVRVFFRGCWRDLLRDNVGARWHYLLSLTRPDRRAQSGQIKLLTESISLEARGEFYVDRFVTLHLEFNQLLVHDVGNAYEVRPSKTSVTPLDGDVFLDGYLW